MRSSQNMAAVEAAYKAFSAGDLHAFLNLLADDFTSRQSEAPPWRGTYHGRAGVASLFERVSERALASFHPEEFIDGGDRIVVVGVARLTPHGNEPFDVRELHLWSVVRGVLKGMDIFLNAPLPLLQALESASRGQAGAS